MLVVGYGRRSPSTLQSSRETLGRLRYAMAARDSDSEGGSPNGSSKRAVSMQRQAVSIRTKAVRMHDARCNRKGPASKGGRAIEQ